VAGRLLAAGALCVAGLAGCTVTKDDVATFKWAAYGNNNASTQDWTGGDGASSTGLPDGRHVYVYNDMFEGSVNQDGSRSVGLFSARNALVVADTNDTPVSTLTGPNGGDLLPAMSGNRRFMWGGGRGIVESNQLKLIANLIGPDDPLGDHRGTYIASFSLPGLQLVGGQAQLAPAAPPSVKKIFWSDLFKNGSYTYIYGSGDLGAGDTGDYVARAPAGNLGGTWEYRTATGWSTDAAQAAGMFSHMAGAPGVIEYQGQFYAFAMEHADESSAASALFSNKIRACVASTPYGPFPNGQCTNIYTVPEAGQTVAQNTILHAYAVSPHFDDINGDGMLLSYSTNALCLVDCPSPSANQQNVAHYRPRWLRVLPD
jgi:hypothetical protein